MRFSTVLLLLGTILPGCSPPATREESVPIGGAFVRNQWSVTVLIREGDTYVPRDFHFQHVDRIEVRADVPAGQPMRADLTVNVDQRGRYGSNPHRIVLHVHDLKEIQGAGR